MRRLSRQAFVLFAIIIILIFLIITNCIFHPGLESEDSETYTIKVVADQIEIQSVYVDSIPYERASSEYSEYQLTLSKGTQINDYTLSQDQTFSKYIQFAGPDGQETLYDGSSYTTTHYAYSVVLSGDLVETTNDQTQEKTYKLENAQLTCDVIKVALLSDQNSVVIAKQSQTEEKTVSMQSFVDALKSLDDRETMLEW